MNWLTLLGTGDEGNDGIDEEGKLYLLFPLEFGGLRFGRVAPP